MAHKAFTAFEGGGRVINHLLMVEVSEFEA
jgi:hypothetical protein